MQDIVYDKEKYFKYILHLSMFSKLKQRKNLLKLILKLTNTYI